MNKITGIPFATTDGVFDLISPPIEAFEPSKIASALGKINRYGGRTHQPWSVAAHSVFVYELTQEDRKEPWALLHDAHETFIGDITSPGLDLICARNASERNQIGGILVRQCVTKAKKQLDEQIAYAWGINIADISNEDRLACEVEMNVFFQTPLPEDREYTNAKSILLDMIHENLSWNQWAARWGRIAQQFHNPPRSVA